MDSRIQIDTWIFRAVIVLGLILMMIVVGVLILRFLDRPAPEILIVLGFITTAGLIRLLISPLNQVLTE